MKARTIASAPGWGSVRPPTLDLLDGLLRASLAAGTAPDELACGLRIVAGEPAVEILVATRRELMGSLRGWPTLAVRLRTLPTSAGFPLLVVTAAGMTLSTYVLPPRGDA